MPGPDPVIEEVLEFLKERGVQVEKLEDDEFEDDEQHRYDNDGGKPAVEPGSRLAALGRIEERPHNSVEETMQAVNVRNRFPMYRCRGEQPVTHPGS